MDALAQIRASAERVAQAHGLELFDVQLVRESPGWVVRVTIDRPGPYGGLIGRAHQLWAHAHPPAVDRALPAHVSGEHVRCAELARDLADRFRRSLVLPRARAADHAQSGDPRETATHLVGEPVGEVRIGGESEILEWQHDEHRPFRRGGAARAPSIHRGGDR